ncbi:hypothetical protein FO519_007261 [Halicephalobus sp. NKZ332]|nr:hypothetical protein FO519_007261 [Halicephalobus sp. NKZ332]
MVRRRRAIKRRVGKKGKRRRKRKRKRVPKVVRKIRSVITGAKKVLIHNLGFDPQKEKPADFTPVIPDIPSLPDSEKSENLSQRSKQSISNQSVASEDLLDIILGAQEQMFIHKKRRLTQEEMEEKERRRREREAEMKLHEEAAKRRQIELKEMEKAERDRKLLQEKIRRSKEQAPTKPQNEPKPGPPPPVLPLSLPGQSDIIRTLGIPPAFLQPTALDVSIQQILLQQQQEQQNLQFLQQRAELELLALHSLQQPINPFINPNLMNLNYGLQMPLIAPPQNNLLPITTAEATTSFIPAPPPPPPPPLDSAAANERQARLESLIEMVKPLASKYGRLYDLSHDDYKKMVKKVIKKVSLRNTGPPKYSRVERLVKDYAKYFHAKAGRRKHSQKCRK